MTLENFKYKGKQTLLYIKEHWAVLSVLVIGIYFFIQSAFHRVEEVTIAKRDTSREITYVTQPTIHTESYQPFRITDTIKQQTVKIPQEYKPSEDIAELKKQVTELGNKLYRYNRYKDTIYLKDTAGTVVGNVNIEDSITQNMIASRKSSYTLKFPKETMTITNTLNSKPSVQFYGGIETSISKSNYLNQLGGGFILKTKDDKLIKLTLGAQFSTPIQPYVSLGYYPRLSFK